MFGYSGGRYWDPLNWDDFPKTGPVFQRQEKCKGHEVHIDECQHDFFVPAFFLSCKFHSNDIGVQCFRPATTTTTTTTTITNTTSTPTTTAATTPTTSRGTTTTVLTTLPKLTDDTRPQKVSGPVTPVGQTASQTSISISVGGVAGGVVGAVVLLALALVVFVFWNRRRGQQEKIGHPEYAHNTVYDNRPDGVQLAMSAFTA